MGGLFSRLTVWGNSQTLTATALNNEFNNIITNFIPQMMQGYSANVSQMQTQTNPGTIGTESLAASLSGELERIRYVLAEITGNSYWYIPPSVSLAALNSALGANIQANSVSSGLITAGGQPAYLVPSGSTNSVTLQGAGTAFVYRIAGNTYTISTNVTLTSLTAAPSINNTMVINDSTITATNSPLLGENGSVITVATMGSAITALAGQLAAFKTDNASAEYVIARVESTTTLTQVFRGYFFNSSSTLMGRQSTTNAGTWTLMKLTWIYATTVGTLVSVYTNPSYSATAPTSPSTGDMWYNFPQQAWYTYNGTTWVAANMTLIGTCITNSSSVTIGARSNDFFATFSALNDIELFADSTTVVRAKYPGSQASVYGTIIQFGQSMPTWNTSTVESGQSLVASTMTYFYLSAGPSPGNSWMSPVAPYYRPDLQGYYHPGLPWRCLGWTYLNGSTQFNVTGSSYEVESLYKADQSSPVSTLTAAVTNYPLAYNIQFTQKILECNANGGAFTQVLPPASQWRGQTLSVLKTDSSTNAVTVQAWGTQILSTTANTTLGSTAISSLASTAGLVTTTTYNIQGLGIQPGTTVVWTSGASATLSTNAYLAQTGVTVVFASGQTINGSFTTTLNTQNEMVDFFSDGTNIYLKNRYIPSIWTETAALTLTASSANPTKGTISRDYFLWRRVGSHAHCKYTYAQTVAGTSGTGDYIWTLPAPLVIDTTIMPGLNSVIGGASGSSINVPVAGSGTLQSSNGTSGSGATMYAASSTTFKIVPVGSAGVVQSAGVYATGSSVLAWLLDFTIPIAGWNQ